MSKQVTVTLPEPLAVNEFETEWPGGVDAGPKRKHVFIPGSFYTPDEARTIAASALAAADFIDGKGDNSNGV